MSTFCLQAKLLLDGAPASIPNAYAKGIFPYWVSNDTGCYFKTLKVMVGKIITGTSGGTITLTLYGQSSKLVNEDTRIDPVTVDNIKKEWDVLGTSSYTCSGVDIDFGVMKTELTTTVNEPSFVVGLVSLEGDIVSKDMFVWCEYENNPPLT